MTTKVAPKPNLVRTKANPNPCPRCGEFGGRLFIEYNERIRIYQEAYVNCGYRRDMEVIVTATVKKYFVTSARRY